MDIKSVSLDGIIDDAEKGNNVEALLRYQELMPEEGKHTIFNIAFEKGKLNVLTLLKDKIDEFSHNKYYIKAIEKEDIDIVKLFISWSWSFMSCTFLDAIRVLRFDILLLLIQQKPRGFDEFTLGPLFNVCLRNNIDPTDITIDILTLLGDKNVFLTEDRIMYRAFDKGLLRLIKYLNEHKYPYTCSLYEVCMKDISLLRYLYEVMGVRRKDGIPVSRAVMDGNIECFEYLISKKFKVNKEIISNVLHTDKLDMIKYLHENKYEWDNTIDTDLLEYDNIRQYCHDNDIPKKWQCESDCYYCSVNRVDSIINQWEMESEIYSDLIQWLPKEIIEDTIELVELDCNKKFNEEECTEEDDADMQSWSDDDDDY